MENGIRYTNNKFENNLKENIFFEDSINQNYKNKLNSVNNNNTNTLHNKELKQKNKEMDEVFIKNIFSYENKKCSFNDEITPEINKEEKFLVSKYMKQKSMNKKIRSKITRFNQLRIELPSSQKKFGSMPKIKK